MKRAWMIVILAGAISARGEWNQIGESNTVVGTWPSRPISIGQTGHPTDEQLHSQMVFERIDDGTPPPGQRVIAWRYDHVGADRAVWVPTGYEDIPVEPAVEVFPDPQIIAPVLDDSGSNKLGTARVFVSDDLDLIAVWNEGSVHIKQEQLDAFRAIAESLKNERAIAKTYYLSVSVDSKHDKTTKDAAKALADAMGGTDQKKEKVKE